MTFSKAHIIVLGIIKLATSTVNKFSIMLFTNNKHILTTFFESTPFIESLSTIVFTEYTNVNIGRVCGFKPFHCQ